jgi:lysophospholipase L1-like esterase
LNDPNFLTSSLFRFATAMALATACCSVSAVTPPDTAVLRVTGQRDPAPVHCPPPKARTLTSQAQVDMQRLADGDATPLTMVSTPKANAYTAAVKIGLWGDSHTASGSFADSLLEALHLPLAQTRPSFIAPTFGLKGVRQPLARACLSDDWQLAQAYRSAKEAPENYAKSLSAIHTEQAGALVWLDFRYPSAQARVKWADIHIGKGSGEQARVLGVTVDDGAESIVKLAPDSQQRLRVQSEQPFATLRLRVLAGAIRIDGIAPVYEDKTPVIMDVFSVPGATAKGWRIVNADHLRREDPLPHGYDVVILQSGTNESLDPDFKVGLYEQHISASLTRLKATYPRARCILIGPPDAQKSAKTLRLINDSQSRVARAKGCTHWNWQKAMGGPGAAQRWLTKGLMQADLLHLTPEGYAQSARSLASMVAIRGQ